MSVDTVIKEPVGIPHGGEQPHDPVGEKAGFFPCRKIGRQIFGRNHMQVGRPQFGFAVVVAAECEAGAGMFQRIVPVGNLRHPSAGYIKEDFAAVETLRQLLKQQEHGPESQT